MSGLGTSTGSTLLGTQGESIWWSPGSARKSGPRVVRAAQVVRLLRRGTVWFPSRRTWRAVTTPKGHTPQPRQQPLPRAEAPSATAAARRMRRRAPAAPPNGCQPKSEPAAGQRRAPQQRRPKALQSAVASAQRHPHPASCAPLPSCSSRCNARGPSPPAWPCGGRRSRRRPAAGPRRPTRRWPWAHRHSRLKSPTPAPSGGRGSGSLVGGNRSTCGKR